MSEYKIGFIGTGNMGSAIARAVRKVLPGHEIILQTEPRLRLRHWQTSLTAAVPIIKPLRGTHSIFS